MDTASALISSALAVIFLLSGVSKLRSLSHSADTLAALRLPPIAPRLAVGALSIAEIILGVGVAFARPVLTVTAVGAALLSLAFLIVVWRAYRLGSTDDCGCFGDADSSRVSPALIVRNAVLAATAAVLATFAIAGADGLPSVITTVVSGDTGALLPLVACALVATLVGAVVYARLDGRTARDNAHDADSSVHRPQGVQSLVVLDKATAMGIDVARRARGRAQLLVFVKPGCTSCDDVLTALEHKAEALARVVDVTTIADIAHGDDVSTRAAGDPRITALDIGGHVATTVGVGARRPSAALLAVDGTVVEPQAEGSHEIGDLIDAIAAAAG